MYREDLEAWISGFTAPRREDDLSHETQALLAKLRECAELLPTRGEGRAGSNQHSGYEPYLGVGCVAPAGWHPIIGHIQQEPASVRGPRMFNVVDIGGRSCAAANEPSATVEKTP